ncbi:TetR family transcriptional regulator [Spirillospora sp. NPDC029432]|uniref:TetR family transcriptional regulator n=1 Tax=Spirillospora sp. NPDC029432 TaxID=3154599 RepID=UPI00345653E0
MERTTRRSPRGEERKTDAERSRRLLLDAALEEFAAKGYAGARVQDIADRAGVNKQLISYYFGGKAGLYQEIGRRWLEREEEINDPEMPLECIWVRYLEDALADPRGGRLNVWRGLTEDLAEIEDVPREDLSTLRHRQREGELADDLEPEALMLMMMSMVTLPTVMPHMVRSVYGLAPDSPEFKERYAEQLRRIARHLSGR